MVVPWAHIDAWGLGMRMLTLGCLSVGSARLSIPKQVR